MIRPIVFLLGVANLAIGPAADAVASPREQALRAAIHPVATVATMEAWLARVPITRDFPPDLAIALQGHGPAFVVEISTAPGCLPCADLWAKLHHLGRQYGWRIGVLDAQEALTRSGRLGLPWVGNPVAWVRPVNNVNRIVPVAVGTDHTPNLARNLYLAAKMLTGVRADVGVRALSKFTGIVGASAAPAPARRKD